MTREDLAAVVRGLAPVVREVVAEAIAAQTAALGALEARVAAFSQTVYQDRAELEARLLARLGPLEAGATALSAVPELLGTLRERVAVAEARAPVPGPPGPPGFGLDDFRASFDGERTVTVTFGRGAEAQSHEWVLPLPHYAGTYRAHTPYPVGAMVTWEGSLWMCREATSAKPLEGAKAWTLVVKRGRDGRDGKDAAMAALERAS